MVIARKDKLLLRLQESPDKEQALEALFAHYVQREDPEGFFGALVEYTETLISPEEISWIRTQVPMLLDGWLKQLKDSSLVAVFKLRLARLLSVSGDQPQRCLMLAAESLKEMPSGSHAAESIELIRQTGQPMLLVQLLRRKAAGEHDPVARADTLAQLGFVALGAGMVYVVAEVMEILDHGLGGFPVSSLGRLRKACERKVVELEERKKALKQQRIYALDDEERYAAERELGLVLAQLGEFAEAMPLLEMAARREPSLELFIQLRELYRTTLNWPRLLSLLEWWADQTCGEDRKQILMERARLLCAQLGRKEKGFEAAFELWSEFTEDLDAGLFCAQLHGEFQDPAGQAEVLKVLREEAQDRELEMELAAQEAKVRWLALDQWDDAERIFRKLRATDPDHPLALKFYQHYYRRTQEWPKLFRVLASRVNLTEGTEQRAVVREMAELSLVDGGPPDRAMACLRRVLELEPMDRWAVRHLAELLDQTQRWHALLQLHRDLLAHPQCSQEQQIVSTRAVAEILHAPEKLNLAEMAIPSARTLLQLVPGDAQAYELLADCYRRTEQWELLVELLRQRVAALPAEDPLSAVLEAEIARVRYRNLLEGEEVIPDLERALERLPDDTETLQVLMMAYQYRGDLEKLLTPGSRLFDLYLENLLTTPEPEVAASMPKTITLVYGQDTLDLTEEEAVFEEASCQR